MPISVIPCEVYSHSNTPIIHLTKLDPFVADWGQFEWSFKIIDASNSYPVYPSLGSVSGNVNSTYNDAQADYNMADAGTGAEVGQVDGGSDEKSCPACTFLNPMSAFSCEVCGSNF
jgi:hypothetical protein